MYADEIDRAQEYEHFETQEKIRIASQIKKRVPIDPGFCDECEEVTPTDMHLFCSAACRALDEKRQRMRAIQGGHHEGKY